MRAWKATAIGAALRSASIATIAQQGSYSLAPLSNFQQQILSLSPRRIEAIQTTGSKPNLGARSARPIGRAVFRSDVWLSATAFA
jgi:hypothetical protein